MNYQRIIVVGNITGDALYKKSKKSGMGYTSFSVAVNSFNKETTYFPVIVFGKRAKPLAKHLRKGRGVLVEGRIKTYDKRRFNVIADNIDLGVQIDPRKKHGDTDG